MMNISILCVYNNDEIMNDFSSNLGNQKLNGEYQLIPINNKGNVWHSIREAYNSHLDKIKYDMVVFIHQDIRFMNESALQNLLDEIEKISDFGIIGIAGCKSGKQWKLLSSITHGLDHKNAGETVQEAIEVQTVDECCFVMHTNDIQRTGFSEIDGWHMYAVEQCLWMAGGGKENYVIPAENIWHMSNGQSLDPSYMITLEQVLSKYCKDIIYLNTTVKQWKVHGLFPYLYRKYYYVKQVFKRMLFY